MKEQLTIKFYLNKKGFCILISYNPDGSYENVTIINRLNKVNIKKV